MQKENILKIHLLLVDDQKSYREQLARKLNAEYHFVTHGVSNVQDAMKYIEGRSGNVDVVLLDEILEDDAKGIELLKWIKGKYQEIEVILFTGWGRESGVNALIQGAARYLTKPVDWEEIGLVVTYVAEQRAARREIRMNKALDQIATDIRNAKDTKEILANICKAAVQVFEVEHSGLLKLEPDRLKARLYAEFPLKVSQGDIVITGNPVEERVFTQGEIVNCADVLNDPDIASIREILLGHDIRSILIIPIKLDGKVIASLSLDSIGHVRQFSIAEEKLCQKLVCEAESALSKLEDLAIEKQKADYLEKILENTNELAKLQTSDEIMTYAAGQLYYLAQADFTEILLYRDQGDFYTVGYYPNEGSKYQTGARRRGVSYEVLQTGLAKYLPDIREQSGYVSPYLIEIGVITSACLPIEIATGENKRRLGVLWIHYRYKHEFTPSEKRALGLFINQMALIYQRARQTTSLRKLNELSNTDSIETDVKLSAYRILEHTWRNLDAWRVGVIIPKQLGNQSLPDLVAYPKEGETEFAIADTYHNEGLTQQVMSNRNVYWNISPKDDRVLKSKVNLFKKIERFDVNTMGVVPMLSSGKAIGALWIGFKQSRILLTSERELLQTTANALADIYHHHEINDRIMRINRITPQISGYVTKEKSLRKTLCNTARDIQEMLMCDSVVIYAYNNDEKKFFTKGHAGFDEGIPWEPSGKSKPTTMLQRITELPKPVVIDSISDSNSNIEILANSTFKQRHGILSVFAASLKCYDDIAGVIFVNYKQSHHFAQQELDVIEHVSNIAAVTIRNSINIRDAQIRSDILDALRKAGQEISEAPDLHTAMRKTVEYVREILRTKSFSNPNRKDCTSYIAHYSKRKLSFVATDLLQTDERSIKYQGDIYLDNPEMSRHGKIGLSGFAAKSGKDIYLTGSQLLNHPDYILIDSDIKSQYSIRILANEQLMGVLSVESTQENAFSEDDQNNLQALVSHAAASMQKAQLQAILSSLVKVSVVGDIENTLQEIANMTSDITDGDTVVVYTFDSNNQRFEKKKTYGYRDVNNSQSPNDLDPNGSAWTLVKTDSPYLFDPNLTTLNGKCVIPEQIKTSFGLQLRYGNQIVGVIICGYRREYQPPQSVIDQTLEFAKHAAVAIRNTQLTEDVSNRAQTFEALFQAGKMMLQKQANSEREFDEIAKQSLLVVGEQLNTNSAFAHLFVKGADNLVQCTVATKPSMIENIKTLFEVGKKNGRKGLIGLVLQTGRSVRVNNVHDQTQAGEYIAFDPNVNSQLSVAIKSDKDDVLGVLSVESYHKNAFTELHQQALELLAANAALILQQADTHRQIQNRTLLAWTGMMSSIWKHGIDGDAVVVREYARLIQEEQLDLSDDSKQSLSKIEQLANKILNREIANIPYAAIEGDKADILDLHKLASQCIKRAEENQQLFGRKVDLPVKFSIRLVPPSFNTLIRGNEDWLRRAFNLLVENAVEAILKLPQNKERKVAIEIQQDSKNHQLLIRIRDNGVGIPENIRPKILVERVPKQPNEKGHGIGLLMAQMIIETYQGKLSLENTGAEGTTFLAVFPIV